MFSFVFRILDTSMDAKKDISDLICNKENVMQVLTKLKPFSAHGPDGIPTKLLLDYVVYLADPLTTIQCDHC